MSDQPSSLSMDGVLVQLVLQTRENALRKLHISNQIKGLRSDICERRSLIQALQDRTERLAEDIRLKQAVLAQSTDTAKSIKATNGRLHQYEQTLKEKAQSQSNTYNQELEVLEEKYTSCKNTFQTYKEYYCQHPLAQKLLALQTDKEKIERRIEAYDEELRTKEKELTRLTDISTTSGEIADSADWEPLKEPEKLLNPQEEEDSVSSIDLSSFHIDQPVSSPKSSVQANTEDHHEEHDAQDMADCVTAAEQTGNELSVQQNEQTWHVGKHTEEQDQEQQPSAGGTGKAEDQNMKDVAMEEEQAPVWENAEALPMFSHSSQETNPRSPSAAGAAVLSTPMFNFNFSPGGSPHQQTPNTKSAAFLFSLSSDPSPGPIFPGFKFDMGPSQDEGTSFGFTGPFFSEKRTSDSKASSCPEFVFNQQEQSEDFQFGFSPKSPQKDNKGEGFPFSFTF